MQVYIIYSHPYVKSFNQAILESFTRGLAETGHSIVVSDLYADNFKPDHDAEELEQILSGKVPDSIKPYQKKVAGADAMAFIYPIWWYSPPAMLKGWFDRILTHGFAFSIGGSRYTPLLKHKKALIINTAGLSQRDFESSGIRDAMYLVMENSLCFCGVKRLEQVIFYEVTTTDDATRKRYLEQAHLLGKNF